MTTRKYSSRSQQTTLASSITSTATSATVISASALMGGVTVPAGQTFTVVIDPDTALEEIVDITNWSSGNTLTISRGIDTATPGTGQEHSAGAVVRHMMIGRDLREANTHIEASASVHGVTGSVVGTTDSQVLSNKTLTTPTIASFANATHNHTNAAGGGTLTSAAISDFQEATEDVVGAMVSSNSESGISVTYDDATGKLNFDVSDPVITLSGDVTGSATITNLGNTTITTTIPAGTIVNADINSAAAIDKTKISGTAITAADTGTVNTTILADLAVTTAKLVDSNVTTAKIADLNVTTGKIADSAITSAKIADATIVNADISTTAAIALSKLATDPLARANHTGTQTASTISDFDTQVRTSRLDQMTAPTADISLATYKVTNLGTPTVSTDASTKGYVDSQITALVGGAPGTLDTLNEIAAAINNSGSFATSVVLRDGTQAMTGALAMGTNKITGLGTPTASTDAVTKAYADAIIASAPGNLTGPITSVGAATSVASQTGTGSTFVMNTSPTIITPVITASSTTDALRITNTGTGYSLLVEDSANPDTTPFIIDHLGRLILGNDGYPTAGSGSFLGSIVGTGSAYPFALYGMYASTAGARIAFHKSRSTAIGTYTTVVAGDALGDLVFYGDDGTAWQNSASIRANADATPSGGAVPGRLVFLTTDSAGTSTERMRIDSAGQVGIGAPASTGTTLRIGKNLTGAVISYGIYNNNAVQSDVTTSAQLFSTFPSVVDTAFTLGSLVHFQASQGTKGASATITNQYGYLAQSTLTGATNNYGFYGNLAAASGVWNTYMNGTAANYFAGRVGIGQTNTSGTMALIANTTAADVGLVVKGAASQTGDLLQIQNSAGSTMLSVNSSGVLYAGTTTNIGPASANIGVGVSTATVGVEIGTGRTGDGTSYVDLGGDATYTDFGLRLIRNSGANSGSAIISRGTGSLSVSAQDAGSVVLNTNNITRLTVDAAGNTTINSIAAGTTSTAAVGGGYMGLPQNSTTTGAYTVVAADAGKHIYSTATRTVTIDSNANLALPVGTTLTFISGVGATTTIAITTDTMYLAGTGTTGSRTLAAYGMATAVKIASTTWIISGNGLT